ncbi:MAG TPA: hypothetical protein VGN42_19775 [Pirellulales bacterium]|jgi:hypothetical protein|nr:hypothetical protein [Pirellulales bacterium]
MKNVTRRSALKAVATGTVAAGAAIVGAAAAADEPNARKLWRLEGELKVHPKYIYRYYLEFGDGQKCALYGADHGREPDQLTRIKLRARVRVRGELGTEYHSGGTKANLSPFPATWTLYMDVHEVEAVESLPPLTAGPPLK